MTTGNLERRGGISRGGFAWGHLNSSMKIFRSIIPLQRPNKEQAYGKTCNETCKWEWGIKANEWFSAYLLASSFFFRSGGSPSNTNLARSSAIEPYQSVNLSIHEINSDHRNGSNLHSFIPASSNLTVRFNMPCRWLQFTNENSYELINIMSSWPVR